MGLRDLTFKQAWDWSWHTGKKAAPVLGVLAPILSGAYLWAVASLDAQAQEYVKGVIAKPLAEQATQIQSQAVQIEGLANQVEALVQTIGELQADAETPFEQSQAIDKLNRVACLLEAQARGQDAVLRCDEQ